MEGGTPSGRRLAQPTSEQIPAGASVIRTRGQVNNNGCTLSDAFYDLTITFNICLVTNILKAYDNTSVRWIALVADFGTLAFLGLFALKPTYASRGKPINLDNNDARMKEEFFPSRDFHLPELVKLFGDYIVAFRINMPLQPATHFGFATLVYLGLIIRYLHQVQSAHAALKPSFKLREVMPWHAIFAGLLNYLVHSIMEHRGSTCLTSFSSSISLLGFRSSVDKLRDVKWYPEMVSNLGIPASTSEELEEDSPSAPVTPKSESSAPSDSATTLIVMNMRIPDNTLASGFQAAEEGSSSTSATPNFGSSAPNSTAELDPSAESGNASVPTRGVQQASPLPQSSSASPAPLNRPSRSVSFNEPTITIGPSRDSNAFILKRKTEEAFGFPGSHPESESDTEPHAAARRRVASLNIACRLGGPAPSLQDPMARPEPSRPSYSPTLEDYYDHPFSAAVIPRSSGFNMQANAASFSPSNIPSSSTQNLVQPIRTSRPSHPSTISRLRTSPSDLQGHFPHANLLDPQVRFQHEPVNQNGRWVYPPEQSRSRAEPDANWRGFLSSTRFNSEPSQRLGRAIWQRREGSRQGRTTPAVPPGLPPPGLHSEGRRTPAPSVPPGLPPPGLSHPSRAQRLPLHPQPGTTQSMNHHPNSMASPIPAPVPTLRLQPRNPREDNVPNTEIRRGANPPLGNFVLRTYTSVPTSRLQPRDPREDNIPNTGIRHGSNPSPGDFVLRTYTYDPARRAAWERALRENRELYAREGAQVLMQRNGGVIGGRRVHGNGGEAGNDAQVGNQGQDGDNSGNRNRNHDQGASLNSPPPPRTLSGEDNESANESHGSGDDEYSSSDSDSDSDDSNAPYQYRGPSNENIRFELIYNRRFPLHFEDRHAPRHIPMPPDSLRNGGPVDEPAVWIPPRDVFEVYSDGDSVGSAVSTDVNEGEIEEISERNPFVRMPVYTDDEDEDDANPTVQEREEGESSRTQRVMPENDLIVFSARVPAYMSVELANSILSPRPQNHISSLLERLETGATNNIPSQGPSAVLQNENSRPRIIGSPVGDRRDSGDYFTGSPRSESESALQNVAADDDDSSPLLGINASTQINNPRSRLTRRFTRFFDQYLVSIEQQHHPVQDAPVREPVRESLPRGANFRGRFRVLARFPFRFRRRTQNQTSSANVARENRSPGFSRYFNQRRFSIPLFRPSRPPSPPPETDNELVLERQGMRNEEIARDGSDLPDASSAHDSGNESLGIEPLGPVAQNPTPPGGDWWLALIKRTRIQDQIARNEWALQTPNLQTQPSPPSPPHQPIPGHFPHPSIAYDTEHENLFKWEPQYRSRTPVPEQPPSLLWLPAPEPVDNPYELETDSLAARMRRIGLRSDEVANTGPSSHNGNEPFHWQLPTAQDLRGEAHGDAQAEEQVTLAEHLRASPGLRSDEVRNSNWGSEPFAWQLPDIEHLRREALSSLQAQAQGQAQGQMTLADILRANPGLRADEVGNVVLVPRRTARDEGYYSSDDSSSSSSDDSDDDNDDDDDNENEDDEDGEDDEGGDEGNAHNYNNLFEHFQANIPHQEDSSNQGWGTFLPPPVQETPSDQHAPGPHWQDVGSDGNGDGSAEEHRTMDTIPNPNPTFLFSLQTLSQRQQQQQQILPSRAFSPANLPPPPPPSSNPSPIIPPERPRLQVRNGTESDINANRDMEHDWVIEEEIYGVPDQERYRPTPPSLQSGQPGPSTLLAPHQAPSASWTDVEGEDDDEDEEEEEWELITIPDATPLDVSQLLAIEAEIQNGEVRATRERSGTRFSLSSAPDSPSPSLEDENEDQDEEYDVEWEEGEGEGIYDALPVGEGDEVGYVDVQFEDGESVYFEALSEVDADADADGDEDPPRHVDPGSRRGG